jgi:hypothetical protein
MMPDGLYTIMGYPLFPNEQLDGESSVMATAANNETAVKILHHRLGHVDKAKVRFLLEQSSANGMTRQDRPDTIDCTPCAQVN